MNQDKTFQLAEILNYSISNIQSLPFTQMNALIDIVFNTSEKFLLIPKIASSKNIIDALTCRRGNEESFKDLLNSLNLTGIVLTKKEQNQLLLSISRNPETKIVNIPLFFSLYKVWSNSMTKNEINLDKNNYNQFSKADYNKINDRNSYLKSIRQTIQMEIPSLSYILDLISQRLHSSSKTITNSVLTDMKMENIQRETFLKLLRSSDIILNDENFSLFINALSHVAICNNDGDINLQFLLDVCNSSDHLNIDSKSFNILDSSQINRLVENIVLIWSNLKFEIVSNKLDNNISESKLLLCLRNVGVTLSERDIRNLWIYILTKSNCMSSNIISLPYIEINLNQLQNAILPANYIEILKSISVPNNNESEHDQGLSVLMRDLPTPRQRKYVHQLHNDSLGFLSESDKVQHTVSNHNHPSVTGLPWQKSESASISNLQIRIKKRISEVSLNNQLLFLNILIDGSKDKASMGRITRSYLTKALIAINIKVNKEEAEHLFSLANEYFQGILTVDNFASWMNLDSAMKLILLNNNSCIKTYSTKNDVDEKIDDNININIEKIKEKRTLPHGWIEYLSEEGWPYYYNAETEVSTWSFPSSSPFLPLNQKDSTPINEDIIINSSINTEKNNSNNILSNESLNKKDTILKFNAKTKTIETAASLMNMDNQIDHLSINKEYENLDLIARNDSVKLLQSMRPRIALVFRRLMGSRNRLSENSIKCIDFATALTQEPLSLNLSNIAAWRLTCDMAKLNYSCDKDTAMLMFSDVTNLLDSERSGGPIYIESQLVLSIKNKLNDSKYVLGDKFKLLALTSILRQRLRFFKGRDKQSEECSVQDLRKLFESIDVHFNIQEAKFICNASNRKTFESSYAGEIGIVLGTAILFLANTILSSSN